jgi:hypothetical protein
MRVMRAASDNMHLGFEELLLAAWMMQSAQLGADPKLDELQSETHSQKQSAKEGDVK